MPIILAINSGSSSLKFALTKGVGLTRLASGVFERVRDQPVLTLNGESFAIDGSGHGACLDHLLRWLSANGWTPDAVTHRVVHGGNRYAAPQRIDAAIVAELSDLVRLAPLHQPYNLMGVTAALAAFPAAVQVACFDTAFHQTNPAEFRRFALPQSLHDEGVQAYGFHGLSYQFVAQAPELADQARVVIAHLGSGASACALKSGKSVSTSMGFTALDGLVMGTRCGSLDAGVVLHLLKEGRSVQELENLLYKESGLKALSGGTADVRDIEARAAAGDALCETALVIFANSVAEHISRLTCRLGGIDALVFTAGVGEHSVRVREMVCERLRFLGVALNPQANAGHLRNIHAAESNVSVFVIPTNEEEQMARNVLSLIQEK